MNTPPGVGDWAFEILKQYGLAGLVIVALGFVIWVLWSGIKDRDAKIEVLNEQRAKEREQIAGLMEKVVAAQNTTAEVTAKRNDIMDELSSALNGQATAVSHHGERVDDQSEMLKEKFREMIHVVDSFGESNRVTSGLLRDIRDALNQLAGLVNSVSVKVEAGNYIKANK